jgi:hypothetical protein
LIDPLCVAALNTPADRASGQVLLTILRDALFSAPGSADLLFPRAPLHDVLPGPALAWLASRGARWCPGQRVTSLHPLPGGWKVDQAAFDHVVIACSAREASRLLAPHAPAWAATAQALSYEPIVTVWLEDKQTRWPQPMMAFPARASSEGDSPAPAQFGFDLGQLGGQPGLFALVISGARGWCDAGQEATVQAVLRQWRSAFGATASARLVSHRAEKRATFACVPGLKRPSPHPLPGISVAGDHVQGPYPATLEAAVRSGLAAVADLAG